MGRFGRRCIARTDGEPCMVDAAVTGHLQNVSRCHHDALRPILPTVFLAADLDMIVPAAAVSICYLHLELSHGKSDGGVGCKAAEIVWRVVPRPVRDALSVCRDLAVAVAVLSDRPP